MRRRPHAHGDPRDLPQRAVFVSPLYRQDRAVDRVQAFLDVRFPKRAAQPCRSLLERPASGRRPRVRRGTAGTESTLQFDDPVNIQYTSGTIGAHGAAVVVPAEAFDAEATLRAIDAERCTSIYGGADIFIAARTSGARVVLRRFAQNGHHGGCAVSDRSDAAGDRPGGRAPGDHLLRDDRDLIRVVPVVSRRSDRASCLDRRSRATAARSLNAHPAARTSGFSPWLSLAAPV